MHGGRKRPSAQARPRLLIRDAAVVPGRGAPTPNPALVAGRPVPAASTLKRGYSSTRRGTAIGWRVAATLGAFHAEVYSSRGCARSRRWRRGRPRQCGSNSAAGMVNGLPRRRRRKGGKRNGAIANDPFSERGNAQELNLREKFAEVRRPLGYIQKRGHNSGITTTT